MNYPIPRNSRNLASLRQQPVNDELLAQAIAGVIENARASGQSLDDLKAEVLADDSLLDPQQRRWLFEIVAQAWDKLA
ncbi:hypothetical protein [Alkalinema sp. FACHB-956]|uniref:hypothetical protein n=1 Tax=Alkalinema sp. FACHB-956 TaxID=2692768 RepID=UPI0016840C6E|nr:hypothetical protein [Alkalinema sp. FACHB-956]MBD2326232.1 hypothetical protein [Alkalinema sp. FACHB-956]